MTTETIPQERERRISGGETASGGAKRVQRRSRVIQIATIAGVLLVWEAVVRGMGIEPIFLPSVSFILQTFWSMILDGTLPWNTLTTVLRILSGFLAAAVCGVAIGIGMGMSKTFQNVCDPLIAAMYPLPKITLIPLLIIWLGSGEAYKLVVSGLAAFFPIVNQHVRGHPAGGRGPGQGRAGPRGRRAQDSDGGHDPRRRAQHLRGLPAGDGRGHHPHGRLGDDREPERPGADPDRGGFDPGDRKGSSQHCSSWRFWESFVTKAQDWVGQPVRPLGF